MRHPFWLILVLFGSQATAQKFLTQKLDSIFLLQPAGQPGIALSIEQAGKIIYRRVSGLANLTTGEPLDAHSNFRMASLTKQFTAMGILLLDREHRLTLDDPIGKWLPELPPGIGGRVMIRHLLTHSSGLLDYETLIPAEQTRQLSDTDVLHELARYDSTYFTPGTQFRYSNSGFCLLALIIQRAAHEPFAQFIQERLFIPLGMDSSIVYQAGGRIPHRAMGYARDSSGHIVASDQSLTSATKGDGGVYTSLADYAKWIGALQGGQPILLAPVLQALRFPIAGMAGSYYAAGWFEVDASPQVFFHSGSTCGFANFVIRIPDQQWHIVYFSNLADNTAPFEAIIKILIATGGSDLSKVMALHDLTR